jgi:predicted dehydrogenase
MLKIALIDHHLNNYHADTFIKLLRGPLADEEAEIVAAWESDPAGEKDWCAANGVKRAATLDAAVQSADAVLLLAPDNIDAHPALAASVLPAGKPVFLDKLLAVNTADAQTIAADAKRHGSPIFSASGLRFATELAPLRQELGDNPVDEMTARGMGRWEHYGVHTLSLALAIMGHGVRRLIDTGTPTARTVTLDYGEGRRAVVDVRAAVNQGELFGWSVAARGAGDRYHSATITDYSGFYAGLLRAALQFFRTGASEVSVEEMLTTAAVLETAVRSQEQQGVWLPLGL